MTITSAGSVVVAALTIVTKVSSLSSFSLSAFFLLALLVSDLVGVAPISKAARLVVLIAKTSRWVVVATTG